MGMEWDGTDGAGWGKTVGMGWRWSNVICHVILLHCPARTKHYAVCENTLTALTKGWCKKCTVGQCESENVLSVAR